MRKAQHQTLIALILLAVVALVILIFYSGVLGFMKEQGEFESCKLSVAAKTVGSHITSEQNIDLECYTRSMQIRKDGVYVAGKDRKFRLEKSFPSGDVDISAPSEILERRQIAMREIADEMVRWWDTMWQGKLSVYGPGLLRVFKEDRCIILTEITFDNDWLGDISSQQIGFGAFLNTNKATGMDMLYKDYFESPFDGNRDNMDPSRRNVIIITITESNLGGKILSNYVMFGTVPTLVTGVIEAFNPEKHKTVLSVGPYEESTLKCGRLY